MGNEISRRDTLTRKRIEQLEARNICSDGCIPVQFSLIRQLAHSRCGKGFGARSDGEERLRGDWQILRLVALTEALRVDDLVLLDDRYSQTPHSPVTHDGAHKVVESPQLCHGIWKLIFRHGALFLARVYTFTQTHRQWISILYYKRSLNQ